MINSIIQGIVDKLAETFPGVTLYTEKVPQNFAEPSFRVKHVTATNMVELGTRKYREMLFDILYFPSSQLEPETEFYQVSMRVFPALEYITAGGDLIRGMEMTADYDAEQEAGRIRVTYGAHILDVETRDNPMITINHNGVVQQ